MLFIVTFFINLFLINTDVFSGNSQPIVCITQIASHPSLNAIADGIEETILSAIPGAVIYKFDAQAQMSIALQTARKCQSLKADIIIPISTPSAQASIKKMHRKSLIVFAAVTDPIAAGIIKDIDNPGETITGTIDAPNPKKQLEFFQEINPALKHIVAIYNAAEQNSLAQLEKFSQAAKAMGIQVTLQAVTKITEISSAMLIHKNADAFFIPNDNLVVSGITIAAKTAKKMNKPLYASDIESMSKGADAAVANDQHAVGVETGKMALKLLAGERNIPVISVDSPTKLSSIRQNP